MKKLGKAEIGTNEIQTCLRLSARLTGKSVTRGTQKNGLGMTRS